MKQSRGDALLVAKHAWFDNANEIFSQTATAGVYWGDKCGKGKGKKKIQNQKTRAEEKEIKAGKRAQQVTGRLLTAYRTGIKEQSFEVRDRSGCPALLDSHSHAFRVSSSLMFTVSTSQQTHFLVTGAT